MSGIGQQQQQQQASRHGGQQTSASNVGAGKAGADKGGNRSARTNEYGVLERRMRQTKSKVVGGGLEMDSSEEKVAGRKQVRFEGKCLKKAFDGSLFYKCCKVETIMISVPFGRSRLSGMGHVHNTLFHCCLVTSHLVSSTGFIAH